MPINPLSYADLEGQDSTKNNSRNNIGGAAGTGLSNGSQISEGASGTFTSTPGTAAPGAKPSSSGSFTNLQNYLKANQDQSQGLGAKIAGSIQNEANQGFSGLGEANKSFNSDLDKASNGINSLDQSTIPTTLTNAVTSPDKLQDSDIQAIQNVENTAKTAGATDKTAVSDPNSLALGPKDLTNYDSYNNAVNTLQDVSNKAGVNGVGSESGRQTLLQDNYARPDYNRGQQQLDQLLLQGNPQNQQRFSDLQNQLLGPNANRPDSNQQVADYTTYTGPSYTIQGQEAAAQKTAADSRGQTQQNLANAYNNITNYLYGNGGSTPLNVNLVNPNSPLDPATDDISNGGLMGYIGQQAQTDVSRAQAVQAVNIALMEQAKAQQEQTREQAAYNSWLNNYNQLVTANGGVANSNVLTQTGAAPTVNSFQDLYKAYANPKNIVYSSKPDASNAVSASDLAKINALNKLAQIQDLNSVNLPGQTSPQDVGTGFVPSNSFNITTPNLNDPNTWKY